MKISVSYGKSMYGGWYANYFTTKSEGIHAETKRELIAKLDEKLGRDEYELTSRYDN